MNHASNQQKGAGGSVRGIVAGYLGYEYMGCDLSEKQIKANYGEIVVETIGDEQQS